MVKAVKKTVPSGPLTHCGVMGVNRANQNSYISTYPNGKVKDPPLLWNYFPLLGLHCVMSSRYATDIEREELLEYCEETFGPQDGEEVDGEPVEGLWSYFDASYASKLWFKEERDYLVFLLKYSGQ